MRPVILGDGLLGSELSSQTGWDIISRKKDGFDITDINCYKLILDYNIVINCIANTDTYSTDRQTHWDVNYKGVADLVDFCNQYKIKLVHISTDYVYTNSTGTPSEIDIPVHQETYYAYTKLLADGYVELRSNDYLLIRETHKPFPFPYSKAWSNQVGNFDYVNIIAKLILKLINKNAQGIYNVGTNVKTMYKLALQTNSEVQPEQVKGLTPVSTKMNIQKLKNILSN